MSKTARPPALSEQQKAIGARIKLVRETLGVSQAEIARALEIDPSTLNKAEKGDRAPSVFMIISLANRFRCSTDYLLRNQLTGRTDEELSLQLAHQQPELVPPLPGKAQGKGRRQA